MNGLASSVPAVRVEGVVKRFGTTVALDGAGLEIPGGMVFGLLGPNGAGKTTLVRILATLLTPDAGRAEVFGHDVVREPAAVRELLGLTGQFAAVDELLTGRENLEMFGRLFRLSREEARHRAGELLERFDLAQAADRPARTYSGGMRRRLDIASSLLTRPRVLFLDEPTTGLDPRSRNEIWAIVRELRREGTTLLLTTQYLEEADQLADRIAVIDRGKVIAEGTGNELKDRVGGQILEVELSSAGQRDRAQAVLAGVGCGEPQPDERPDRLTLPAPRNGLQLVEEAAAELRRAQIGVSDIGLRRPTLDDVFLQLTGAPPSEDGDGPSPRTRRRLRPQQPAPNVSAPRRPALRLRRPPPQAVRSAITDTAVVTGRNLRHFIRQPDLLTFSTIQPVIFVLLFVYVFGGAVSRSLPHGIAYVDFLLPGIFVQSVTFRASQTAVGLSEDLERGVVDRFRSMPMARSAVLAGRTVADLVRNILDHRPDDRRRLRGRVPLPRRGSRSGRVHRRRRRLRLRPQLDLRLRGAHRPGRRGGADGRVRRDLPARLRQLGVRARLHHAALAAGVRENQPRHDHRRRRPLARALWHPGVAGSSRGMDRRPAGRVHTPVRMALPADELSARVRKFVGGCPVSWDSSRCGERLPGPRVRAGAGRCRPGAVWRQAVMGACAVPPTPPVRCSGRTPHRHVTDGSRRHAAKRRGWVLWDLLAEKQMEVLS